MELGCKVRNWEIGRVGGVGMQAWKKKCNTCIHNEVKLHGEFLHGIH